MRQTLLRWCLLGAVSLLLCACRADLLTQVSENDANEVLDALYGMGIDAGKVPAGDKMFNVQVAEVRMGDALRVIQERGLPRPRHADLGVLFKKEGLVSTPSEERVRFIYGVAQQLSATLTQIPGVLYASVQPVMPSNDPLADKIKPASAAVFVKHDPNFNVDALRPAIKDLVMRSIEGLNHDNISLTLVAADPPQRVARVEPILPTWVVTSLSLLAVAAVLGGGAAGFMLWRLRRLAAARDAGEDAAPLFGEGGPLSRLRALWRGVRQPPPVAINEPRFDALRSVPSKTDTVQTP
jgi:type III secretion protein J